MEMKQNNKTIYYIYENDGVIGLEYDGIRYYYLKNLQNDIIGIIDTNGNQIVKYKYDSWGKLLKVEDGLGNEITDSTHIGLINPFRYRSYYYDQETKLYYLNSRYYNPEWCRFISPDSLIGINQDVFANNLYLYVSNDPINNIDQDGQFIISAISLGKKLGKSLKKGLKKLVKEVKKAVSVQISYKKTDGMDVTKLAKRGLWIDVSKESGVSSTQAIVGSDNSPVSFEINISNGLEFSIGVQQQTPIGTISISTDTRNHTYRFESKTSQSGERNIKESGFNSYSAYYIEGVDKDIKPGVVGFDYKRISVSKIVIALAVVSVGYASYVGIPIAANKIQKIINGLFQKGLQFT